MTKGISHNLVLSIGQSTGAAGDDNAGSIEIPVMNDETF